MAGARAAGAKARARPGQGRPRGEVGWGRGEQGGGVVQGGGIEGSVIKKFKNSRRARVCGRQVNALGGGVRVGR